MRRWFLLLLVLLPVASAPKIAPTTQAPNIIFLLFDDATKADVAKMPHVMHDVAAQFEMRQDKDVFRVQIVVPL